MSVASDAVAVRRGPFAVAGGLLAAIVLAAAADTVIAQLALAAGAPDDFQPLKAPSYIFLTTLGILAGALGWSIVRKVSNDPRRWSVGWYRPSSWCPSSPTSCSTATVARPVSARCC